MSGRYAHYLDIPRPNHILNDTIERFIDTYAGTAIGQEVKNMWENGTNYEIICERMGIDYDDYAEE